MSDPAKSARPLSQTPEYRRAKYQENREAILAKQKAYRANSPEHRERHRERVKAARKANPEVHRERDRIRRERSLLIRAKRHIGRCLRCGYDSSIVALQWHHVDPSQKEMLPSQVLRYTDERAFAELSKCVLVCANCHWEVESELWVVSEELHQESVRLLTEAMNRKVTNV